MTIKETLLGFAILGLVIGGVFLARDPGRVPSARGTTHGDAIPTRRVGDAAVDAAMPDVTLGEGSVDVAGIRVMLSIAPAPPVAFETTRVRVRVESKAAPVSFESGRISFEMSMPMGEHRYTLAPGEDAWYEADVVLPMCPSGKRRWYATIEGTVGGQPVVARFRVDLTTPGSAR
jgi:hypothetical protein